MNILQQIELTGAGLVAQRVREQARENILRRLENQESAAVAAATIADIDNQVAALRGQLPGLAEREPAPALAVRELDEVIIDLTAKRARAELDNDHAGVIRIGEQIRSVERQRSEHEATLRTIHNRRGDIDHKLRNLEEGRRELERLL